MKKTKDILEKKIIAVCHFSLTSFTEHLEEYLVQRKIERFFIIQHPLHPIPGRSQSVSRMYKKGKLQKKKIANVSSVLNGWNYIKASLLTIWWVLISKEQWDLYVGNNGLNTVAGLILKRLGKVKTVVFYSVDFVPSRFNNSTLNAIYHWVDKISVIYSDKVWLLSPRMVRGRREYLGLDKKYDEKQILFPEGVWIDRIHRATDKEVKKDVAIFVGTLVKRMGVQLVIESIPYILKKIPNFKLIIIGKGPYRTDLEKLIDKLDLGDHVVFKGFVESHREIENIVATCAVGLAAYTTDESGLTFYADPAKTKLYLGSGIPIVMTDSFYNAHDIADAGAGVLVKDNETEIAKGILKIIGSKKELSNFRKNAIKFAGKFDWPLLFEVNLNRIFKEKSK